MVILMLLDDSVNSCDGKWIKSKIIIYKCSNGTWGKISNANLKRTFYSHIIYQCFTRLKLLVHIQAGLGDWMDGKTRNPRYLNGE